MGKKQNKTTKMKQPKNPKQNHIKQTKQLSAAFSPSQTSMLDFSTVLTRHLQNILPTYKFQ